MSALEKTIFGVMVLGALLAVTGFIFDIAYLVIPAYICMVIMLVLMSIDISRN